jgi:hypothetical protein
MASLLARRKRETTSALKDELAAETGGEYRIHCDIIKVLRQHAKPGVEFWHTPNGGKLKMGQAVRFKEMGLLPGVSDITVSLPHCGMLFLEVKTRKGVVSEAQNKFIEAMNRNGNVACVVRSLGEAVEVLSRYHAIHRMAVAA